MKVLCLADIHLRGGFDTEEAEALMKVADIAVERDVDLVMVNGDIYEAKSTPIQRLVFRDFLRKHGKPTIVLRGNHDEPNDLAIFGWEDLTVVHEQPGDERVPCQDGDMLQVLTIPHFAAGAVALQESSLADLNETGTNLFDRILDDIFQKVRAYDGPSLVAFHGVVSGASLDNGFIPKENGIHLNLQRLAAIGCPVVGGHYHAAQNVGAAIGAQVWYSGSLTRQTFGESEGDKGVLLFEYDGQWHEPEFISLNPTPMILIDAEWGRHEIQPEDGPQWFFKPQDIPKGARVRFRYKVRQSDLATVDLAPIRQWMEEVGVRELKVEQIVEVTTAVRCSEIVEAETVEKCFEVWGLAKGESPERIQSALELLKSLNDDSVGNGDKPVGCNMPERSPSPDTPILESGSGQRLAGSQSSPALPLFNQEEKVAHAF
jgi:DNA repair exonuclease SbcCD nuclease subunit